ncbi:MAG: LicD family protein [Lachnospiraceae bacterium]|nr:LicD family protein [Lachnospiraceae bacterium]
MDEGYYNTEIRDGFRIKSMMKRVWACQLDMLDIIDKACRKYGIHYFADFGTMLGAVREGGYIAWDDDIDIGMTRLDFERFKSLAIKEFPQSWWLKNERSSSDKKGANNVVVHLTDGRSIRTDKEYLAQHHGCPYTVTIDIFVWDNIPDDDNERQTFLDLHKVVLLSALLVEGSECYENCPDEMHRNLMQIEELTAYRFDRSNPIRPQLYDLLDYISAMYYDTETECVAKLGYLSSKDKGIYRREWISEIEYMNFEYTQIPVPKGYDEILKEWYGDYRTPVRGTANHGYPNYRFQEAYLFGEYKKRGLPIPEAFLA